MQQARQPLAVAMRFTCLTVLLCCAGLWTLEAEEAVRMTTQRYNGRQSVPEPVKVYMELMDSNDVSLTFIKFINSPLALVPPQWLDRV